MELVVATLNLRPLLPGRASTVVPSNALAREAPPLLLFVLLRGVTGGFLPLNVVVVGAEAAVAVVAVALIPSTRGEVPGVPT